jgi:hypothetical protein
VILDVGYVLLFEVLSRILNTPVLRLDPGKSSGENAARDKVKRQFETMKSCVLLTTPGFLGNPIDRKILNFNCQQVLQIGHNNLHPAGGASLQLVTNTCGSKNYVQGRFIVLSFSEDAPNGKKLKTRTAIEHNLHAMNSYQ